MKLSLSAAFFFTVAHAGSLDDVQNVVIFMQENRAYDHYFGTLSGVRGFNDRTTVPMPTGLDAFHQPTNTSDYSQYQLPFLAEPNKTAAMCMPAPEMYYPTDIRMWNKGRMDKWNTERDGGVGMSYFDREGLPFYYTLYDNFAAGDQYFQSTFTCTCPNRQHLFSGSNGLSVGQAANEDNTEPTPGFDWPTVAELLEEKDISWKVYQQEDNFDDNGFAWHASFQSATAGDPLYDKGMFRYKDAIEEFTKDIKADTLPQVSWIIAPAIKSEHATNHPGAGEDFTARVLKGLRSNPDVYAKTAFILNYDEGGQFYDHAFTPTPPLNDAEGVSTVSVAEEINTMTLLEEAYDTPAPNGLGYRVPLLLISPWTRGNIVYSEVTDHISVIKFLEKKFDFTCPNVSPWRRAMTGDLLAAFDFENPDYSWPDLPDTSNYVREADVECLTLPDVVVPTVQKMPVQETGTRVSKALDYRFVVTGGVSEKKLSFKIDNVGGQGAPFVLFDVKNNAAVDPKQYAVEGGKSIDHVVDLVGDDYEYFLYGPNGFVRSWSGSVGEEGGDVHMEYDEGADSVVLVAGAAAGDLTVVDNAYGLSKTVLSKGEKVAIGTKESGNWYDFTVGGQRFMGRMETGKDGVSDPAMAAGVAGLWQRNDEHPELEERLRILKRAERVGASRVVHKDSLFRTGEEEL